MALVAGCTRASPSLDRRDTADADTRGPIATKYIAPASARAWPLPRAGRGVAVGPTAASAGPLRIEMGEAARAAVADRCPDHDECVRIANNSADVAHAACDAECARCCAHESVDECVRRECAGACQRCADADCRGAICNDAWLSGCRDRCTIEVATCGGCRDAWCSEGAARRGCHADAKRHHDATLAACERDCKAADREADGSCAIACGTTKKTKCSKAANACALGTSPDCRCECSAAVAGACVTWNAVCVCD